MNIRFIPLVSIVIPTYNRAKFIDKALKSIFDQTFKNWEIIIVDNYSTDDTEKVILKYKDYRVRCLKIDRSGIVAKSRNAGIREAKGEWIAFLDSDDWWTNDKLEICLKNIDINVDFIYHDLEIVYDKSRFNFKRKKYIGRQLKKPILPDLLINYITKGTAIGNSSVIVRKNILTKIRGISENKNLVASEDFNTWARIARITNKFKYINRKLGYYLIHDGSIQKRDLSISHREAVNEFLNLFNYQQKLDLEVKWKYMSGNYNKLINNRTKAKQEFIFVIKNGSIPLKFRSLLKLILIAFK
ncbi:glycosyltransferase [Candidatus Pelagibacter ubique]|nr:glycosyltransferase [Candidatus Pelagibacter ubique]